MAYFTQEMKKEKAPKLKKIFNEYGVKATLGVNHHSTFVINIKESPFDFNLGEDTHRQVNTYWIDKNYSEKEAEFLNKVLAVANEGNFDESDSMTDYFHVGWYVDINIGKWDKPYIKKEQ